MIEVPEPPDIQACAACGPLLWMLSARRRVWTSWLQTSTDPPTLALHLCRHAQDYPTWKQVPHGDPPNEDYLAAKDAIKNKSASKEEREG